MRSVLTVVAAALLAATTSAVPVPAVAACRWRLTEIKLPSTDAEDFVGLNDHNQAVGSWHDSARNTRSYLWSRGVITDLGDLGGNAVWATALTNSDYVIGWATIEDRDSDSHAFVWHDGVMQDLADALPPDAPDPTLLQAMAVNEHGVVALTRSDYRGISGGIWEHGRITEITGPPPGSSAWVKDINDAGQVAGEFVSAAEVRHGFLWQRGSFTDLGTLGGHTDVVNLNQAGDVVGSSWLTTADPDHPESEHAFLWRRGRMTDLGALGARGSVAMAVNARDQVVGEFQTAAEESHAFIWNRGRVTDLSAYTGYPTHVFGLNDRGQVIGYSVTGARGPLPFVWQQGRLTELPVFAAGHGAGPTAINASGVIAGWAEDAKLGFHHVIWTPQCRSSGAGQP